MKVDIDLRFATVDNKKETEGRLQGFSPFNARSQIGDENAAGPNVFPRNFPP